MSLISALSWYCFFHLADLGREVVVLEDAYISSQRNHLENVANALDKHLQYNVDKLIFCVMACAKLS